MKIRSILFPTDFSPSASLALDYAVFLSERYHATLWLFHCDEYSHMIDVSSSYGYEGPVNFADDIEKTSKKHLEEIAARLPKSIETRLHYTAGRAYHEIVEAAKQQNIDLIVMGTRGRSNLSSYFMGSNAERVVRHAPCPVLTIREKAPAHRFQKILFGVDFSSVSRRIFPEVAALAREFDADIIAAHVEKLGVESSVVEESFRQFLSSYDLKGLRLQTEIVTHSSVHAGLDILAQKEGADLIAIGTHGQQDLRKVFLGSTAEDIVNFSRVPVLTLRRGS